MLTFDFENSNFDRQYIQMWFKSWENKCGFMLGRSKLVKTDKIVKSQNVDFLVWNIEVWLWPNENFTLWLKLVEKSNILLDKPTNYSGLGVSKLWRH